MTEKTFLEEFGLPVFTEQFGANSILPAEMRTSPIAEILKKMPRTADVDATINALESGDPKAQIFIAKILASLAGRLRSHPEPEPKKKPSPETGEKA